MSGPADNHNRQRLPWSATRSGRGLGCALLLMALGCSNEVAPKPAPPPLQPPELAVAPESDPGIPTAAHGSHAVREKLPTTPSPPLSLPKLSPPPLIDDEPLKDVPSPTAAGEEFPMKFVLIQPGQYRRGTTEEQLGRILANDSWQVDRELLEDEMPARMVTITKPFEISATEVTQGQYRAVMGEVPSERKDDALPVTMVRYADCVEFCERLSKQTGRKIRLPTEAEWEYAARAGSQSLWCFGAEEDELETYAWYDWNALSGVMPVGKLQPNKWGLYDMHGNVWEWCSDFYSPTYYKDGPVVDPQGPETGDGHVVRGGFFFSPSWQTRSAERDVGASLIEPGDVFRKPNLGFRVVREVNE